MTGAATRAGPVPPTAPGDVPSAIPARPCHGLAAHLWRRGLRHLACGPVARGAGLLGIDGGETVATFRGPERARQAANAHSSAVTGAAAPSAHPEEGA